MNKNILSLFQKAEKPNRRIIGLMSGTSLDGLDIALCKFIGSGFKTTFILEKFITIPYDTTFKKNILSVFSKEKISLNKLCVLHPWVGNKHAEFILNALKNWKIAPDTIDFIASHGQTIYHAPISFHKNAKFPNGTLQIGDGDHIATKTGIITLSDFRQKHLAAGGEGAPLALYGDYLLCRHHTYNRILINIGGIANFTYIPANADLEDVICSDIGPGNTLLDAYVLKHFNQAYDKDAFLAKQGNCHPELLKALMNNSFFRLPVPKSTGPEYFNLYYLKQALHNSKTKKLNHYDVLSTLTHFTALSIARCLKTHCQLNDKTQIYVSGGGALNPLINELLAFYLNFDIKNTTVLGINPNAKEAILFALLANEALVGDSKIQGTTKNPWVSMGKISFPE